MGRIRILESTGAVYSAIKNITLSQEDRPSGTIAFVYDHFGNIGVVNITSAGQITARYRPTYGANTTQDVNDGNTVRFTAIWCV